MQLLKRLESALPHKPQHLGSKLQQNSGDCWNNDCKSSIRFVGRSWNLFGIWDVAAGAKKIKTEAN